MVGTILFGMRHFRNFLYSLLLVSLVTLSALADSPERLSLRPSLEIGFVDIPHHTIQFGEGTDRFDYVRQGGQEILFPYQRLRLDLELGTGGRHTVSLLYQPLTFETVTQIEEGLTIDTEDFEVGQVVELFYGFDFWRGTYSYRFLDTARWEIDGGVSLQIRNASIRFKAREERELVVSQDTGPVPILRGRLRYTTPTTVWYEAEIDGFYASSAFINGAEYPFTGWIWDAAVSVGAPVSEQLEAYLTVRTIGGGAEGTSADPRDVWTESQAGGDERYTFNSITTLSVAAGFRLHL